MNTIFSLFKSKEPSELEKQIQESPIYRSLQNQEQQKNYKYASLQERLILEKSNLTPTILDVPIQTPNISNQPIFIHTLIFPAKNQSSSFPPILLLHGFGGSSLSFYKMAQYLTDTSDVYALDFLGMGLSSRPDFSLDLSIEEIIAFFIDSIEAWRISMNLQKLVIVGHSFGGYMGFHYSLKYKYQVERLILASPMGATTRTAEEVQELTRQQTSGFFKTQLFSIVQGYWNERKTISQFLNKSLVPKNYFLRSYIKDRLFIEENFRELWFDYFDGLMKLPDSSEKGIHPLLRFPRMSAVISLEETVSRISQQESSFPLPYYVNFIYGENDWMCSQGAQRIVKKQETPCSFIKLPKATHQMVFDQPVPLAELIEQIIKNKKN